MLTSAVTRALVSTLLWLTSCAASVGADAWRPPPVAPTGSLLDVGETWTCLASPRGELACAGRHPAPGVWWTWIRERIAEAGEHDELIELHVGRYSACVLDRGGRLSCWHGQSFVHPPISGVTKVAFRERAVCVTLDSGHVACAQLPDRSKGRWMSGTPSSLWYLAARDEVEPAHACALSDEGEVRCRGNNDHCQCELPGFEAPDPCMAVEIHGDGSDVLSWDEAVRRLPSSARRSLPDLEGWPLTIELGSPDVVVKAHCLPGTIALRGCSRLPPMMRPVPAFEPSIDRMVREDGRLSATGMLFPPEAGLFREPRVRARLLDAQGRELAVIDASKSCRQLDVGGCPWAIEDRAEVEGTVDVVFEGQAELFLPSIDVAFETIWIDLDLDGRMLGSSSSLHEFAPTFTKTWQLSDGTLYVMIGWPEGSTGLADSNGIAVGLDQAGRIVSAEPLGLSLGPPSSAQVVRWRMRIEGRRPDGER